MVCPCYRDVPSFLTLRTRVLEEVASSLTGPRLSTRFVVVDDTAGRDKDMDQLKDLPDVRVITPPFNLGHQRALVYGLRLALPDIGESDLIVTMDSDGEDRPDDLPRLLGPLFESPEDRGTLCIARRTERNESLKFRVMYVAFRVLFHVMTGTVVRSGNYAAYRGWLAKRMLAHPYFDLCYSTTLVCLDMNVTPVPCPRGQRYAGESRMSTFRLFMHGIRMLMPFIDRIAARALTAFSVLFAIGLTLFFAVAGIRLFTDLVVPGWATITLLSLLVLSFVALGNFIVLFAVFSHSRGLSLANLEDWKENYSGRLRVPTD